MRENYAEARRLGLREYRRSVNAGRYPYLPALEDITQQEGRLAEVPVGLLEIPLELVVGTRTRGRQNAFADNFMPIMQEDSEFASKWSRLYDSQMNEGIRDPIRAYEYMGRFYVMEGNKRVSVLKFCGVSDVSADVIRVLPRQNQGRAYRIYSEFLSFFQVAPVYFLRFSREGSYERLAQLLGQDLEHPWSEETLENLKAGYAVFEKLYRGKGGGQFENGARDLPANPEDRESGAASGITTGDAFLIYLTIYPLQTLLEDSNAAIGGHLDKLWNEFRTATNTAGTVLVETPDAMQRQKASGLRSMFSRGMAPTYTAQHPLRVAFLYVKTPEDSAWTYGHELGRNYVQSYFDGMVQTRSYPGCDSDALVRRAIDQAAADGARVIFTTSPVQMEETLRSALHYPAIRFLNCSINLTHNAVRTYYIKMYQAKFLMGILAAMSSANHRIGYLADYPIYGVIAGINAFAIGAGMVDPQVRIVLKWSAARKDVGRWRDAFREEDVHVISGPDLIRPGENIHPAAMAQTARTYGLYRVAAPAAGGGAWTIQNLAAPVWNWGHYYEQLLHAILDGRYDARELVQKDTGLNYWFGLQSGVIDIILSNHLSYYERKTVHVLQNALTRDEFNPFEGELHSQSGVVKNAESGRLTRMEVITMNWLNDNVIGHIPTGEELTPEAVQAVQAAGVQV